MARAYQCDRCLKQVVSDPELGIKTNKPMVAMNYAPDATDGFWYAHDLCKECADQFAAWWIKGKE